jgi:hypothetical protein
MIKIEKAKWARSQKPVTTQVEEKSSFTNRWKEKETQIDESLPLPSRQAKVKPTPTMAGGCSFNRVSDWGYHHQPYRTLNY